MERHLSANWDDVMALLVEEIMQEEAAKAQLEDRVIEGPACVRDIALKTDKFHEFMDVREI